MYLVLMKLYEGEVVKVFKESVLKILVRIVCFIVFNIFLIIIIFNYFGSFIIMGMDFRN